MRCSDKAAFLGFRIAKASLDTAVQLLVASDFRGLEFVGILMFFDETKSSRLDEIRERTIVLLGQASKLLVDFVIQPQRYSF